MGDAAQKLDDEVYDWVRSRAEERGMSPQAFADWMAESTKRRVAAERLGAFVDAYEEQHGPIPDDAMDEATAEVSRVFGSGELE